MAYPDLVVDMGDLIQKMILLQANVDSLNVTVDTVLAVAKGGKGDPGVKGDKGDTGDVTPTAAAASAAAVQAAALAQQIVITQSLKIQINPLTPTTPPAGVANGDQYLVIDATATYLYLYLDTSGVGAPVLVNGLQVAFPLAAAVKAFLDSLSTFAPIVGRPGSPIAGTDMTASTYIFNDPMTVDTVFNRFRNFGGSVGGAVIVVKGTVSGSTFTKNGSLAIGNTVTSTAGVLTFADFKVLVGEYVGIFVPNGACCFTGGAASDGTGWRSGSGNGATTALGALQTTFRLELGFDSKVQSVTATSFLALSARAGHRKIQRMFWQLNQMSGGGQSNMEGASGGSVSSGQEFDSLSFPAKSSSSTATPAPATLAATQASAKGETPILGTMAYLKTSLLNENELDLSEFTYQLLGCNNGLTTTGIQALSKGGASGMYANWLTQLAAMKNYALNRGLTYGYLATTWAQGESDPTLTQTQYRDFLLQLALDHATDAKFVTGQHVDPAFVTWQLCSVNRQNALAQRQAAKMRKNIICSGPVYHLHYNDVFHVGSTDVKLLGAMFGKAIKQSIIDGIKFQPLDIESFFVLGDTIYFKMNRSGLAIETSRFPDQSVGTTNKFGYSALNGASVAQTVLAVTVYDDTIAVKFGANPTSGWNISYGKGFAAGTFPWNTGAAGGNAGNIRDSAGDLATYLSTRMDNYKMLSDTILA